MGNRLLMWSIFFAYFAVLLTVDALSSTWGYVVGGAGFVGLAAALLWARPRSGRGSISTHCETCAAQLPSMFGMPQPSCPHCGHRQSWAKNRRSS